MIELARKYLEIYYSRVKTKLPQFKTFEDFVQHYRVDHFLFENYGEYIEFDDFLESYGKSLSYASEYDRMLSIEKLVNKTVSNQVPTSQSFYDALISSVQSFTFEDAKNVIKKSGEQIITVASVGVGVYLAIGLVGFLILTSKK
jgi:hypothetical protein